MARHVTKVLFSFLAALSSVNAYWLMGIEDFITQERLDPIVSPGKVSGHTHAVLGGSNFRMNTSTAFLRQSECTSIPIPEDKSNYWFPQLYFQHNNGSFTSLNGGAVIYYLFSDTPGTTTAFPDDFRMLTGDPTLRTYDPTSYAQQAVTFLCLDFSGTSVRYNSLPPVSCPSGVRAQINFPSCWDGKNTDSVDHKSHVAFLSGGPDSGTCKDPNFPVTLPRIFMEVYWDTVSFDSMRSEAMNSTQPFVFAYGDATGYGYHADFLMGWDKGVLQKAVDNCHCNPYGDPTCCVDQGIFNMNQGKTCRITKAIDEQTTGTLDKLPGNNPVQPFGQRATMYTDPNTPALLSPIYAYTGNSPSQVGTVIVPPASAPVVSATSGAQTSQTSSAAAAATTTKSASSNPVTTSPIMPTASSKPTTSASSGVVSSGHVSSLAPPASVSRTTTHTASAAAVQPSASSKNVVGGGAGTSSPVAGSSTGTATANAGTQTSPADDGGDDDEEDCEDDGDDVDDIDVSSTAFAAATSATTSPTGSSTATAKAGTQTSQADDSDDDGEDCEEDDDDSSTPSASASPAVPTSTSVSSVHHTHAHTATVNVAIAAATSKTAAHASSTSTSTATSGTFPKNPAPACATGKFRHQRLKQAQQAKRSVHNHGRSFHDRFMRARHGHGHAF